MPTEHDPYPCINRILQKYWYNLEILEWDATFDDFENSETLKAAIILMEEKIKEIQTSLAEKEK